MRGRGPGPARQRAVDRRADLRGPASLRGHQRRLPAGLPRPDRRLGRPARRRAAGGVVRLRRRGHAQGRLRQGLPPPAAAHADQRLRPDRVRHHAADLEVGRERGLRLRLRADRQAGRGPRDPCARHRPAAGAGGRRRRALHRRIRPRARLPGTRRPDRAALRGRPLRRRRWAPVPHRRPGPLDGGRQHRIHRPRRPPGQDPRFPHRAGRDRDLPVRGARRAGSGGRGARESVRQAARGLRRRAAGRERGDAAAAPAPAHRRAAAGAHGAGPPGPAAATAAPDQRQAGPRGAARSGELGRWRPPRAAHRGRAAAGDDLAGGAGDRAGRHRRQLLRAGRRFHPQPAGDLAGAQRQARLRTAAA